MITQMLSDTAQLSHLAVVNVQYCNKCGCWFVFLQVEAVVYQTVKDLVKEQFLSEHAGHWNSKKLVDCFSA